MCCIREHRRSFKIAIGHGRLHVTIGHDLVFLTLAMRKSKPILQVSFNPHLTNDVLVQREINRGPIFDNKSRRYTGSNLVSNLRSRIKVVPRQIVAVKKTVDQKVMVPKRIVTSSLKSGVEKNE